MNQPNAVDPYGHTGSSYNAPTTDASGATPSAGFHSTPYSPPQTEKYSRPNPWSPWALAVAVIPPVFIIVLTLFVSSAGFLLSILTIGTGLAGAALGGLALILAEGRRPEHKRRVMAIAALVIGIGWAIVGPFVPMAMMIAFGL